MTSNLFDTKPRALTFSEEFVCNISANLLVRHGLNGITEARIRDFVGSEKYPAVLAIKKKIAIKKIKWFIHNRVKVDHPIWNADFIHGLARNGAIDWNKDKYATLYFNNPNMYNVLIDNNFGGELYEDRWKNVPALYLKYNVGSSPFIAGVLSAAEIIDKTYARLPKCVEGLISRWKIPIELNDDKYIYLSPFWPALLSLWMPERLRAKFFDMYKACNAYLYSAVLWRAYCDGNPTPDLIPYLQSRRSIFYKFAGDNGAMGNLDRLRVSLDLVSLDKIFGEIVQTWYNIKKENNNEVSVN